MKITAALVLSVLLLAPVARADSTAPSVVDGRGLLDPCAAPPSMNEVHLTMVATALSLPAPRWRAGIAIDVCGAHDAAICDGEGRLSSGVTISNCTPGGGKGSLGPVVVCIPGPQSETPGPLNASATLDYSSSAATFHGPLALTLYGAAASEAANICV